MKCLSKNEPPPAPVVARMGGSIFWFGSPLLSSGFVAVVTEFGISSAVSSIMRLEIPESLKRVLRRSAETPAPVHLLLNLANVLERFPELVFFLLEHFKGFPSPRL